jgi:trk system potassium uptake protein
LNSPCFPATLLPMKVIIVGAGNVGIQIARQLIDENKDVVLIDRDPERAKLATNTLDCMVINGQANNREVLEQAGVEAADFFISVTESDELNIVTCSLVRSEYTQTYTIARVRNVDYSSSKITAQPILGIDYIVDPDTETARAIVRSVEHGATSDIMYFEDSSFQMRTLVASEGSLFTGRSLKELKQNLELDFIVAVVLRDQDYIIPSGNTVILQGDTLYLIGEPEVLEDLFSWDGKQRVDLKRIIIVGGGRIGREVARKLLDKKGHGKGLLLNKIFKSLRLRRYKRNLVLIDRNYEKCKMLSEQFPEALVINGDISEEELLDEGDYSNYDLLISATENQELNLVTCLYAKSLGIHRTVSLVNKNNFLRIASHLDVDTTISLNNTMVNSILKLIRRGNIKNVHAISGGKLEIIEISCEEGCALVGKKIQELKLPHHTLIVFISHENESLIPHGGYTVQHGDHIVFITRKESIKKLERVIDLSV